MESTKKCFSKIRPGLCFITVATVLFVTFLFSNTLHGQSTVYKIYGKVVDTAGVALGHVSIRPQHAKMQVYTDDNGYFQLTSTKANEVISISKVGYKSVVKHWSQGNPELHIVLKIKENEIEVVEVNTGYQRIAKERLTGSFEKISESQLNRSQSPDLLSRLEGLSTNLLIDRRTASGEDPSQRNIRLRGVSSIYTDNNPLIILDNFPYEGALSSINANDVLSIDILKDASAASIWGARAANGVIVINTKNAQADQPFKLDVKTLASWSDNPDLVNNSSWLDVKGTMEWERLLFDTGYYKSSESALHYPVLTEYVELLIKQRDKLITEREFEEQHLRLAASDLRADAQNLLYRKSFSQQYHIALSGGGKRNSYYSSLVWDDQYGNRINDRYKGLSYNLKNNYQLSSFLKLGNRLQYTKSSAENNGIGLDALYKIPVYSTLLIASGLPNAITRNYRQSYIDQATKDGLLDWNYRPLDELKLNDNKNNIQHFLFDTDLQTAIFSGLMASVNYRYENEMGRVKNRFDKNGYYVRDLVNQFTQPDGKLLIPHNDILDSRYTSAIGNSLRFQLTFDKTINNWLDIKAIAGSEWRERLQKGDGSRIYGYDPDILSSQSLLDFSQFYEIRPNSFNRIPAGYNGYLLDKTDRNISYYTNIGAMFYDRYLFSFSARKDASNLFGVNTNKKWTPLWSTGIGWIVSKEAFLEDSFINHLKLRATYGKSGNTNKNTSTYITAQYFTNTLTGLPNANIRYPANPDLRWETTRMLNFAVDFSFMNNLFSGSVEYYRKKSDGLLGEVMADPTSGFRGSSGPPYSFLLNYADISGSGLDINLTANWIKTNTFNLTSIINFSKTHSKVEKYNYTEGTTDILNAGTSFVPIEGYPLDALFTLPWAGLNDNGDPQYYLDGNASSNYGLLSTFPIDQLVYNGSKVPVSLGSLQHIFSYKDFGIACMFTYKGNYYYTRSAVSYSNFLTTNIGHQNFENRWVKKGDELTTNVPAFTSLLNSSRDQAYSKSSINVVPADHIDLQSLSLTYSFKPRGTKVANISNIKLSLLGENFGALWRKNKENFSADRGYLLYNPPTTYSFVLNLNF